MNNDNKIGTTWESTEQFLAVEVIQQSKIQAKRWFVAWLITLAVLAATNAGWIYVFQSYDYVSQDGNGVNSYKTEIQGDLNNGPESQR